MMMRILGILLIACAALPASAKAADLSTIDCIAGRVSEPVRAQLAKDVERNLTGTGPASYDPSVTQALRDGALACQKENGWTDAALKPATAYTQAKLGWPIAQRLAGERGMDAAVMETIWLGLPEEQRSKPLTSELRLQLAETAIPEGPERTGANGHFVSGFFQLLSVMEYASVEFSQA